MSQLARRNHSLRPVSFELDSPELAAAYDATSLGQFNQGRALIALLAPQPGERVLDVGCGTGRLGEHVAELVAPEGLVFGIDPLPLRVAIAARKHPRFRVSLGRAEALSGFAADSFAVWYSNSVFHWLPDQPAALREAARVLEPGGRIGLNSADAERPHQYASLLQQALADAGLRGVGAARAFGMNYRVDVEQLALLLRAAGFVQLEAARQTIVDDVAGIDDLLTWSASSSFGNFLSELEPAQRQRVRDRLAEKLEALRGADGIKLERYLVVATARKP